MPNGLLIQWGSTTRFGRITLNKSYSSLNYTVITSKGNPNNLGWMPGSYLVTATVVSRNEIVAETYEKGGTVELQWMTIGY